MNPRPLTSHVDSKYSDKFHNSHIVQSGEERFKKLMERVKHEWENFEVWSKDMIPGKFQQFVQTYLDDGYSISQIRKNDIEMVKWNRPPLTFLLYLLMGPVGWIALILNWRLGYKYVVKISEKNGEIVITTKWKIFTLINCVFGIFPGAVQKSPGSHPHRGKLSTKGRTLRCDEVYCLQK